MSGRDEVFSEEFDIIDLDKQEISSWLERNAKTERWTLPRKRGKTSTTKLYDGKYSQYAAKKQRKVLCNDKCSRKLTEKAEKTLEEAAKSPVPKSNPAVHFGLDDNIYGKLRADCNVLSMTTDDTSKSLVENCHEPACFCKL